MKKVAVLYIATGKYVRLWPGFLESAEKYLLKSCEVEYFVFTDVDHLAAATAATARPVSFCTVRRLIPPQATAPVRALAPRPCATKATVWKLTAPIRTRI